jgi:serine/threonine-protein kinase
MPAETFGNYRVVSKVGSGGMGTVFLAEHERISRRAAIKVLAAELAHNPDILRRFFNEARATSLMQHPGIVEVLDCGVHEPTGRPYIVMEYLEGETLAARLARMGRMGWERACERGREIAEALRIAHQHGIVHRDLKPENVFLVAGGEPGAREAIKVLDFGVAKLLHEAQSVSSTHPGKLLGTPEYMAPEQCGGPGEVDERTDIYALGCLLYELLCGEPPFTARTLGELVVAHLSRVAPAASSRAPFVPAPLDRLIGRMLSKRPADRPRDMGQVAQALAAILEGTFARAEPPATTIARDAPSSTTVAGAGDATPSPSPREAGRGSGTGEPDRHRRVWLAVAGVGVAVIAATAIAVVRAPAAAVATLPAPPPPSPRAPSPPSSPAPAPPPSLAPPTPGAAVTSETPTPRAAEPPAVRRAAARRPRAPAQRSPERDSDGIVDL